MYEHINTHIYTCIYTHTHIHIHIQLHIYIYVYCIMYIIDSIVNCYTYMLYNYTHIKLFCIGIINTILEPETSALRSTRPQTRRPDQPPCPLLKLVGNRNCDAFFTNSNQSEHRTRDSIVTNYRIKIPCHG